MAVLSSQMIEFLLKDSCGKGKEERLAITPLLDRKSQLKYDESSIDLRLGTEFIVVNKEVGPMMINPADRSAFLEQRRKYQKRIFVPFGKPFNLHPHEFALARTLEYVSLPKYMAAYVIGRSSLGRLGLVIATATMVHPLFQGTITLELANVGTVPIVLYPGMRIAQLAIHVADCEKILAEEQNEAFQKFCEERKKANGEKRKDRTYQKQYRTGFSEVYQDEDLQFLIPLRHEFALGIVGEKLSGKSTAIRYLAEECGYRHYSISHIVRRKAEAEGIHVQDSESLKDFVDQARKRESSDYWAKLLVEKMRSDAMKEVGDFPRHIVIDGIKNTAEADYLKKDRKFHLIAVMSNPEIRYKRAREADDRVKEPKDLEPNDARDNSEKEYGQQVRKCICMVDASCRIDNDSDSPKDLAKKLSDLIKKLKRPA